MAMLIERVFQKTASVKLPKDSKRWNQEVLRHLFDQYEWLDVDRYHVQWSSRFSGDEGYGTGVVVLEKEGKKISIPVVVRAFEMQPLDLFYFDNTLRPLTPRTVEQAFYNTDIADKLVDKKIDSTSMFNTIFPPHWGRYIQASVSPENLCKAIDILEEDMEMVRSRIKEAAASLHLRPQFVSYFQDILGQKTIQDDSIEPLTKISGVVISKDETAGYRVGYIENDRYVEKVASYMGVHNLLQNAFGYDKSDVDALVDRVDQGEHVSPGPTLNTEASSSKLAAVTQRGLQNMKIQPIRDDSWVVTQTKSGNRLEGMVVPYTYSFDTKRMIPEKLLVDRDRNILAISEDIVGVRKSKAPIHQILHTTRVQYPRPGMTISFAWRNLGGATVGGMGQTQLVATQPVKLITVEVVDKVGPVYTVLTPFGGRKRVIVLKGNKKPVFDEKNDQGAIYLPENAVILYAKGQMPPLVETPDEYKRVIIKEAACIELSRLKNSGEIMVKTASGKAYSAPINEVRSRLVHEGLDGALVNEAIKYAASLGSHRIYADKVGLDMIKTAGAGLSASEAKLEQLVENLREVARTTDLVKIAVDGAATVDTLDKVLSLNFVNRRNLAVFFKMLPKFKETVYELSRLLLSSRIGKIGVDPDAVSDALHALQNLVESMEGLKLDDHKQLS